MLRVPELPSVYLSVPPTEEPVPSFILLVISSVQGFAQCPLQKKNFFFPDISSNDISRVGPETTFFGTLANSFKMIFNKTYFVYHSNLSKSLFKKASKLIGGAIITFTDDNLTSKSSRHHLPMTQRITKGV